MVVVVVVVLVVAAATVVGGGGVAACSLALQAERATAVANKRTRRASRRIRAFIMAVRSASARILGLCSRSGQGPLSRAATARAGESRPRLF